MKKFKELKESIGQGLIKAKDRVWCAFGRHNKKYYRVIRVDTARRRIFQAEDSKEYVKFCCLCNKTLLEVRTVRDDYLCKNLQ